MEKNYAISSSRPRAPNVELGVVKYTRTRKAPLFCAARDYKLELEFQQLSRAWKFLAGEFLFRYERKLILCFSFLFAPQKFKTRSQREQKVRIFLAGAHTFITKQNE